MKVIVERATSNALRQERARGEEAGGLLSAISASTDKQNKTVNKNKAARHHMPLTAVQKFQEQA